MRQSLVVTHLGVAVEVPRELDLAFQDLLVDTERVVVVERRVAVRIVSWLASALRVRRASRRS